ncbi:hypothetical protein RRF57_013010 [Xylaria bambusicola]|uniref:Myb-like DNA-binding domain-containing protein n=1 Tax=Xylaria bambusicola TaxID=326684 RepID=A0AAN7ZF53_9PEZI
MGPRVAFLVTALYHATVVDGLLPGQPMSYPLRSFARSTSSYSFIFFTPAVFITTSALDPNYCDQLNSSQARWELEPEHFLIYSSSLSSPTFTVDLAVTHPSIPPLLVQIDLAVRSNLQWFHTELSANPSTSHIDTMSSNNDNAMTRFLFAILRQKNLKDINWEQVAHDPILAQPITNGHAARMRYSRFKSAMLGLEPTKRTRTTSPNSKVTKPKRAPKPKKHETVKTESTTLGSPHDASPESPSPTSQKIKQESLYNYNNRMTPALTPGPVSVSSTTISNAAMLQNRFLTPVSDTDTFAPSPVMASTPTSDIMHSQAPFDFQAPSCPDHVDTTWAPGNSYFAAAYPFDDYTSTGTCDHSHLQPSLHSQYPLSLPSQSIENDIEQADVKREDWTLYD